jgi:hypothetical protein
MAELAALADGTLAPERRAAVEARVAASPELRELVARQRRAVLASSSVASDPTPASLHAEIEAQVGARRARRGRAWRLFPRLALGGGVAALAAVVLVVGLSGGTAGPSVADAAGLAARPATGPAPDRLDDSRAKLAIDVEGVVFPDLARSYGWRPVGVRHDQVDGRNATVVFYAKEGRQIGYVIVAGDGLPRPSEAQATVSRGVEFQTLRLEGRPAVTWQRLGHTCVLTGEAAPAELLALAGWRGGGTLSY